MTAVFVGVMAGAISAIVGWQLGRRRQYTAANSSLLDAAPRGSPSNDLNELLGRHPTGILQCSAAGEIVYRNDASNAVTGSHTGVLIDEAVERVLFRALRGDTTDEALELFGPPPVAVVISGHPLPSGGAVAFIDDNSQRRRLDAVRTDFVANISHELKTPVGALAVLAETLSGEADMEVVNRLAARMVAEAHRATVTIDDLLELSEIELGAEPGLEPLRVADLVEAAVARLSETAHLRGIELAPTLPAADVTVPGDRRQLVSALGNLIENAIKYSDAGDVVRVRTRTVDEHVELSVIDEGVGIPQRDLDRIFERFYRVDLARSRGTGGTGLGLSIVRHVATNHRGEVRVTSSEGSGSEFVLRLPVASPSGHRPAADDRHRATTDTVAKDAS